MNLNAQQLATTAPVIVRIAGRPAEVMEQLANSLSMEIATRVSIEEGLDKTRAAIVDRLHVVMASSSPELRRFLLAVKRDCYNGRPLSPYRALPAWENLRELVGPLAEQLLEGEVQREHLLARFAASYREEARRQSRLLWRHLDEKSFLQGLALASPVLFRSIQRLRGRDSWVSGRRGARLCSSLLRYLSRATFKLSPFSTFTRLALGQVRSDAGDGPLQLQGDGWRERSLLRLKRYLLDQYTEMLQRYPRLRTDLPVVLNSSITETEDGSFLFLRPSHWQADEQHDKLIYIEESLVRTTLRGPLVSSLRGFLSHHRPSYGELLAFLTRDLAGGISFGEIERELGKLLDIGFLNVLLPWPSDAGHLEKRMLEFLESRPSDPHLNLFLQRLKRLVALEEEYYRTDDPATLLSEIETLLDDLWEAAATLGGLDQNVSHINASAHNIYQDVFLLPAAENGQDCELLHFPGRGAYEALRSIAPLLRLTRLFDHRHEMLHTLVAWAGRRWPGRRELPLLELFHQARSLWREYVRFLLSSRDPGGWRATWNPLGLPDLAELHRWRTITWESLEAWLQSQGSDEPLSPAALSAILDTIPPVYTEPEVGGCLFLQPVDAFGTVWVLNRVKEGTGRYGSRYTPVMDESIRQLYTSHFKARGVFDLDGERVELLDILSIRGDTLNVHSPQTPRVLVFPGTEADLQGAQRLSLADLRISFSAADRRPHLRDCAGQRYLTAHLGVANEDFMPSLVRFLCLFGPSELSAVFPPQRQRTEGEVTIWERTVLGNLVLRRKSWSFPKHQLLRRVAGQSEAEAFITITRWRRELVIPERVFLIERVPHRLRGERWQPQFLDFTSPLFVSLFRSVLEAEDSMTLVEMLPTPESFPSDGAGRRWAVEVLLDSLALRTEDHRVGVQALSPTIPAVDYEHGSRVMHPEKAMG